MLSVGSGFPPSSPSVDPKKALENLYRTLRQQTSTKEIAAAKTVEPTKAIRKMESFPGDLRPFNLLARCY